MRRTHKDLAGLNDLDPLRVALTADASDEERGGEAAALAAYRAVSWTRRRSVWWPAVLATKLGAATAVALLGLTGVATAAYTGSLPDALQDVAHKTIKAPKAHPPAQAVGPDAKGEAAYGLCQAFAKDKPEKDRQEKDEEPEATPTNEPQGQGKGLDKNRGATAGAGKERGQAREKSVAYRNLVRAAGGEDKVEAYCATVPKPSGEPESGASPKAGKPSARPSHPAGKPSDVPSAPQSRPTGPPSPLPTGSPSPLPTGSPADVPAP